MHRNELQLTQFSCHAFANSLSTRHLADHPPTTAVRISRALTRRQTDFAIKVVRPVLDRRRRTDARKLPTTLVAKVARAGAEWLKLVGYWQALDDAVRLWTEISVTVVDASSLWQTQTLGTKPLHGGRSGTLTVVSSGQTSSGRNVVGLALAQTGAVLVGTKGGWAVATRLPLNWRANGAIARVTIVANALIHRWRGVGRVCCYAMCIRIAAATGWQTDIVTGHRVKWTHVGTVHVRSEKGGNGVNGSTSGRVGTIRERAFGRWCSIQCGQKSDAGVDIGKSSIGGVSLIITTSPWEETSRINESTANGLSWIGSSSQSEHGVGIWILRGDSTGNQTRALVKRNVLEETKLLVVERVVANRQVGRIGWDPASRDVDCVVATNGVGVQGKAGSWVERGMGR